MPRFISRPVARPMPKPMMRSGPTRLAARRPMVAARPMAPRRVTPGRFVRRGR